MEIQLSSDFMKYLESLPEQGMGYQIVDIYLENGRILREKVVLNSTLIKLEDNEMSALDRIVSVKISLKNKNDS